MQICANAYYHLVHSYAPVRQVCNNKRTDFWACWFGAFSEAITRGPRKRTSSPLVPFFLQHCGFMERINKVSLYCAKAHSKATDNTKCSWNLKECTSVTGALPMRNGRSKRAQELQNAWPKHRPQSLPPVSVFFPDIQKILIGMAEVSSH